MTKLLRWGLVPCALLGFTMTTHAQTGTVLTATRSGTYGGTLSGSLKTVTGSGVPFTNVYVNTIDTNARLGVATHSSPTGTVPRTAVKGQMGIVIGQNAAPLDGACVCNGAAAAVVGGLTYTDAGNNDNYFAKVVPTSFPYPDVGMSVQTFDMQPNETWSEILTTEQVGGGTKGQQFKVTPNTTFTLNAPIMATANAAQAGYVFLEFLDSSGHVVPNSTTKIWFQPNQNLLQTVTTDLSGNFSLNLGTHIYLADPQIRVDFPGNSFYGVSSTTVAPVGLNTPNTMPALQQPVTSLGTSAAPLIVLGPMTDFFDGINSNGWGWEYGNWGPTKSQTQILRISSDYLKTFSVDDLAQLVWNMNHATSPLYLEVEIQPNDNWNSNQPAGCTTTSNTNTCCHGDESYTAPDTPNTIIALLMQAGANVSIVAMDEPFYNGAVNTFLADGVTSNPNACVTVYANKGLTYTAADEANNASLLLSIYNAAFPKLIFGDIEPFPILPNNDPSWASTTASNGYPQFIQTLESPTGPLKGLVQISFIHIDDDLDLLAKAGKNVSTELGLVAPVIRPLNMKLGVIVDGRHSNKNSVVPWMQDAEDSIWCIINSGVAPEQLAFESWDPQPTLTVPDNNPQALASLIAYYENRTSGTCSNGP
jgi:hypothetical protein